MMSISSVRFRAGIAGQESFCDQDGQGSARSGSRSDKCWVTKILIKGEIAEKGVIFNIIPKGNEPESGVKYYYRGVPTNWTPPKRKGSYL